MSCLKHLENVTRMIHDVHLLFYKVLKEGHISKSVWLSYVQGFQGWGVGRMVDGEFIKHDGLSGNHVLFFQAVDAFLGMERYLSDQDMTRYIPAKQRDFCLSLKQNCFRDKLDEESDANIKEQFSAIAKHVRVSLFVSF